MRTTIATICALTICLLAGACGGGGGGTPDDSGTDGDPTPDTMTDTSVDTTADTGADTTSDTAVDTPTDTTGDTSADTPTEELPVGEDMGPDTSVVFLHHSTGGNIWGGGVASWFDDYNGANGTSYAITETAYPSSGGYGWANYPYDYWNIWVEHAGGEPYMTEATLEMLTEEYDVIVFKHCYPVSHVVPDEGAPDVASSTKSRQNYQLQYEALEAKMREFPDNRFIVWTGAALVASQTDPDEADRARDFFRWVVEDWDDPGDNIFVWNFWHLETVGLPGDETGPGLYLRDDYASSPDDSHPGGTFSEAAAPLFAARVVDVIQGNGDVGSLTGE